MDEKQRKFLNKNCKLVLENDFVLFGKPTEIDTTGVVFQTRQKTSFIAWTNVKELSLDDRGGDY